MKTVNIYMMTVLLLLLAAVSAGAQNIDPTVVVSRDYEGKLMEVHKPKIEMAIPDSVLRFDLEFDYSVSDSPYKGAYDFTPYVLDLKPSPAFRNIGRLYLSAGAGYQLHPELDFVWTPALKSDAFRMSVYAHNRSYFGNWWNISASGDEDAPVFDRPDKNDQTRKWSGPDVVSKAGINGKYDWNRTALRFEAGYYGLYQQDMNASSRTYDAMDVNVGLFSKERLGKGFGYSLDLAYRYGGDNIRKEISLSENLLGVDAQLHSTFSDGHRISLDMSYDMAGYEGFYTANASFLSLSPHYVKKFRNWDIDLGLVLSKVFRDPDGTPMFRHKIQGLYPDVRIALKAIPSMSLYVEAGGGARMNTYSSLLASDRRVDMYYGRGQELLDMTDERVRAVLGIEGRITSRFSYGLEGGYVNYGYAPLWAVVRQVNGDGQSMLPALTYDAWSKAFVSFDWKLRTERIDFDGFVEYVSPNSENQDSPAILPAAFAGDVSLRYNWKKRVYAGVSCDFSSARRSGSASRTADDTYASAVIPGYADLGVELEYLINHRISLWAKGGNLLNMTIQRSLFYAQSGPYFTLGFSLNL